MSSGHTLLHGLSMGSMCVALMMPYCEAQHACDEDVWCALLCAAAGSCATFEFALSADPIEKVVFGVMGMWVILMLLYCEPEHAGSCTGWSGRTVSTGAAGWPERPLQCTCTLCV